MHPDTPVTYGILKNTLNDYPTKGDLKTILGDYPTKDDLKKILENYPTKKDMQLGFEKLEESFNKFCEIIMKEFAKMPKKADYDMFQERFDRLELNHETRIEIVEDRTDTLKHVLQNDLGTKVIW